MAKYFYFIIILFRVLMAPLIFIFPFQSVILSFFLDVIDIEFASRRVITLDQYEKNDKIFDLWWYAFCLFYSFFYLKHWFNFLLILFLYRLVGDVIFFVKGHRKIFMLFPNFFENVFFLLFFSNLFESLSFLISKNNFFISIIAVSLIKIFQEWWIHWAQISIPEDFFGKKRHWKT